MPLPYQQRYLKDQSTIKIIEKSRRIGISWIEALDCVLWANRSDGFNTYYVGYNYEMSEQFILDCREWAELIRDVAAIAPSEFGDVETFLDDEGILNYRLRFANGRQIVALSSRPTNLRSRKGRIVIDEVAFHQNVEELLKAAMAVTIWGGQIRLISTHNGADNPFNKLVKKAKKSDSVISHHKVTFKDARSEGLYRRICQAEGVPWLAPEEDEWEDAIREAYGAGASEEMDVIPTVVGAGLVFTRNWFRKRDAINYSMHLPQNTTIVRYWDLAATEKKLDTKGGKQEPCDTAGVKIARVGNLYYVLDCITAKLGPADIDDLLLETAHADGLNCAVRWELEGGSSGIRDAAHIASILNEFDAQAVPPRGDKVRRARPWASQLKAGNAFIINDLADEDDEDEGWNKKFIDMHVGFPEGPKDIVDAASGAYTYLSSGRARADDYYAASRVETPLQAIGELSRARRNPFRR